MVGRQQLHFDWIKCESIWKPATCGQNSPPWAWQQCPIRSRQSARLIHHYSASRPVHTVLLRWMFNTQQPLKESFRQKKTPSKVCPVPARAFSVLHPVKLKSQLEATFNKIGFPVEGVWSCVLHAGFRRMKRRLSGGDEWGEKSLVRHSGH